MDSGSLICFSERLELMALLSNKSFNQIEKELGYPRNALHNYKNGSIPSALRLMEIADYFKIDPNYLIGRSSNNTLRTTDTIFNELSSDEKKEMTLLCQKWLLINL